MNTKKTIVALLMLVVGQLGAMQKDIVQPDLEVGLLENARAGEQQTTPPRLARPEVVVGGAKQGSPSTERKKLSKIKAFKKALKERLMSLSPLKREAIVLFLLASAGTAVDVAHHLTEGSAFEPFWASVLIGISEGALATLITQPHAYWKKLVGAFAMGFGATFLSEAVHLNWVTAMAAPISFLALTTTAHVAKLFGRTPGVAEKIRDAEPCLNALAWRD